MKKKHGFLFGCALIIMAAIFMCAGCKDGSDDAGDGIVITVQREGDGGAVVRVAIPADTGSATSNLGADFELFIDGVSVWANNTASATISHLNSPRVEDSVLKLKFSFVSGQEPALGASKTVKIVYTPDAGRVIKQNGVTLKAFTKEVTVKVIQVD
jgi:hypothetical protein